MSKPLCVDLFCGLGGWSLGFLAEGYECVGYDIEAHDYGTGGYPGTLILRDVLSIHGSEFKDAACIVASPPCQAYSYRAMPWKRAKALPPPSNELFESCFRIQREAIEAAGHYIPMVVENVRGAQKWVGRAKANYGSFYLWGDVGMVGRRVVAIREGKILGHGVAPIRASKVPGFRFDGSGGSFQIAAVERTGGMKTPSGNCSEPMWKDRPIARYAHPTPKEMDLHGFDNVPNEGYKTAGMNWSDPTLHGQDFTRIAGNQAVKNDGSGWTDKGSLKSHNRLVPNTGVKQSGICGPRNNGKGDAWFQDGAARHGSKSNARKMASAMIAKIPFALSQYIAQSFKPEEE